jgi:hypothetical protein
VHMIVLINIFFQSQSSRQAGVRSPQPTELSAKEEKQRKKEEKQREKEEKKQQKV